MMNRDYSTEERQSMAKKGQALPDGSFPIADREDLENAIQAFGRASDPAAAKAHIKKRARELGLEELIPEGWSNLDVTSLRARIKRPLARHESGRTDWYRIQNKAGETPALYIYDEIGYFGQSAGALTDDLKTIEGNLNVHLNSPGGDIFDGLAIYQALRNHQGEVTMHVDGLAASIASVIAMAGDKIVMAPKASMMIHDGWSMGVGNAADLRKLADLLDKQSDVIASVYADRSGQPQDFWRAQMREETWYSAQEALDAGLVDEVQGQEKKVDDPFDLSVFAHAGRENAPAPVVKAETPVPAVKDEVPVPAPVEKEEEKPSFTWDFAAFQSALKEGLK